MLRFIEAIRNQPCLWNPTRIDYREQHVKDEAWLKVVSEANIKTIQNIQTAKMEWKKLRDNHRDALKRAKLGMNKLLPPHITTWKYAKAMRFLEPHMKYRITEHIDCDTPALVHTLPVDPDASAPDLEHDVSEFAYKRRRLEDDNFPKIENDSLGSFFNCILQSTREMPPHMQTKVKKKIFAVMIEAEEEVNSQTPRFHDEIVTNECYTHYDDRVEVKQELATDSD